jgi:UDP-N-acetyl-2-amino-2-deoxyglucuronate dehydrogenase
MLSWIFGKVQSSTVYVAHENKSAGHIQLEKANVTWMLSLDRNDLPKKAIDNNQATYRSIQVDNEEIEFSGGFTDLHTVSYQEILNGRGYGISDASNSIEIAHMIRSQKAVGKRGEYHPFL